MSAVAARKAALAKLATASAGSSALSSPMQSPAPELTSVQVISQAPDAAPIPSSSRIGSAKGGAKKNLSKRTARDSQKSNVAAEKAPEKRYYDETVSREPQGKGKRAVRTYEKTGNIVTEEEEEEYVAITEEASLSQSEGEEELDFPALEMLQTISSGRPKKKRRISTSGEQTTHSNFTIQQGYNVCRLPADKLSRLGSVAQHGPAVCISLEAAEFITFSGMALITPLQGTLNLYSSILHPSTAPEAACPHRLFAPLTSPLPVIRPSPDAPNSKTPSHLVEVLDLPSEMQLKGRTVFLLQEMDCGLERLGQAVMTLGKVWPDVGSRGVLGIRGAFPLLHAPEHAVYPHCSPDTWSMAFNLLSSPGISDAEQQAEEGPEGSDRSSPLVAIVKGPKRSGKSTFAREAVNRLLNRYETVAYLDCDLGQSEFGPGGTVGLYVVRKPLFGPAFTHPLSPVQAHFVGSLNPRLESAHYLQSIASLLEHYRYELQYPLDRSAESSEDRITEVVPLIVNTQGWVKGLGADLLDQIEAMVEATHTFTFNSNCGENGDAEESRVFAGEDYEMASERTLSMGYGTVIPLESAPASGLFSRFSPADSRTLSTIAYLHARLQGDEHPDWEFSDALVGKLPWEVDTDNVIKEIYLSGEGSDGILADDLGLALNGSIVALLERIGDSVDPIERYSPGRVLPSPVETRCVGLGLIRAASADQSVIQLITPIPPNQLGRISIIVKGDLELPLCGSLDWKTGSANDDGLLGVAWDEVPFLSVKPERGVGMGRRRFRRNLMRKNQGN